MQAPPRRSQDSRRPNSPGSQQLRRSSSDVSHRPRLLAKLRNAGASSNTSNTAGNASHGGPIPIAKPPPGSHSRVGSNPALTSGNASTTSKTSSKSARDMHRLGTMPAQVALTPGMNAAASASSLSLASTVTATAPNPGTSTDPWHMLHVHVLPLFNGEPLRIPIEDLNQLVQKRISSIVSRSPSRAIGTLEQDVVALIGAGMMTINVKLSEVEDDKLLTRVVEVWEFFWHQVLPYVEGVFHPLQTDKLIRSLSRTPKSHRPSSPTLPEEALQSASPQSIDVRTLTLRSFRDSIIVPISSRLHGLLSSPRKDRDRDLFPGNNGFNRPRFQQMLLVLVSIAQHSHSLSTPSPQPPQSEAAVTHLLRAVRSPHTGVPARPFSVNRLPSFFTGSAPRDRRGRIARKSARYTMLNLKGRRDADGDWPDNETPRNQKFGDEREREREFLESLRSPVLDADELGSAEAGGWGLGRGQEHRGEEEEEEEEEELLNWDEAQDVVERMVGLRA